MSGDELVEVLDDCGRVVGVVTRARMRADRLPHRATFVIQLRLDPDPAISTPCAPGVDEVDRLFETVDWAATRGRRGVSASPLVFGPQTPGIPAFDGHTPVVVHRRAEWKDVYPDYWDAAFGGVCAAGEPWLTSARRELAEEAGIMNAVIVPAGAGRHVDEYSDVFGAVFLAFSTASLEPSDGEVVETAEVAVGELDRWIAERPVCPDSAALVQGVLTALTA